MVTTFRAWTYNCKGCRFFRPPAKCAAESRTTGLPHVRDLKGEMDKWCAQFRPKLHEEPPPEAISLGAGVNSIAMTITLWKEGWRGPLLFADPGSEHPDTYCYIDYFEREWLAKRGGEITRISPASHPYLYTPSYRMTLLEKCEQKDIVPLILNRWCTTEYKRTPLTRMHITMGIQTALIGIAAEEADRAWERTEQDGIQIQYPLLDRAIDREQCKRIIEGEGLVVPPKSGCWFCPFQEMQEWRMLYDLRPDLFQKALDLDNAAIAKMKEHRVNPFEGQLLYKFKTTLETVKTAWDHQLELPLMPAPEYEHKMCECRI
jgi:hypothetical protein